MPTATEVYSILRHYAQNRLTRTYGDLSQEYNHRYNVWVEPHGSWDYLLDEINKRLDDANLPPISAVIVNQDTRQPGGGFWGCCTRTRVQVGNDEDRLVQYAAILNEVFESQWPIVLP